jgi:predicted  nucleic acid-binding Zn-ribbon protein
VVNENVRVALFGLSKLQAQMNDLNQEIKVKNRELEKGKLQLEARNKEYEDVTKKSEETSKELDRVESQRIYMEQELSSVQDAYDEAGQETIREKFPMEVIRNGSMPDRKLFTKGFLWKWYTVCP